MTSLSHTEEKASLVSQDVMDAVWSFPEGRFADSRPPLDAAGYAKICKLVQGIHRQLFQIKKIQPRKKIKWRPQSRVRARRSPSCARRATTDSGGGESEGGDREPQSRRSGQAARLYQSALQVTDFSGLTGYLDRHNANTALAIQAGAKGATNSAGESAVIWPIYHPADIFARGRVTGFVYDTPGSDTIEPRGKQFVDRRSGGVPFGALDSAHVIYITCHPSRALAIHGATGRPCLSLITPRGVAAVAEATARQIADRRLHVIVVIDEKDRAAADACVEQIKLTAPKVKIQILPYKTWNDDFLDALTESVFTTETPRPRGGVHDDFLAGPDLSGGPLGPEPPPLNGPLTKNVILIVPWRVRKDAAPITPLPSLEEMREEMENVLPGAIKAAMEGKPVLIKTPPGGGKTTILERLLPTIKNAKGRPVSFLWLGPTKEITGASCERVGGWLWDGRQVDGMCNLPKVTGVLMDRGRSPHQNACMTCPHGKKPTRETDDDTRCQFQKNLSEIGHVRRVFGQHAAGGRESTLYKFAADPRDEFEDRDLTIIDEAIPTDITTEIQVGDIMAARSATARIDDHISNLKARAEKKRNFQKKAKKSKPLEDHYSDDDFRKARDWAAAIAPHLEVLAGLVVSSPKKAGLHILDAASLDGFIKLGHKIPKAAQSADATCLERVENIFGTEPVVPLAWIRTLSRALKRGTAWVRVTPHGSHIVCTNPSDLWERFLRKGGILLDASCLRDDEVRAAGGIVIDLKCKQPNLRIIQHGPRLHGRGGLQDPARQEQEAAGLLEALGDDQDAVAITHKPLSKSVNDERVRWWGTHRGHNDWSKKKRLILWGLPLLNPSEQVLQYATHRAAMAARGITIEAWDGSTSRDWVQTDSHEMIPAARLPLVKDARDWLIRALNAEIMQGVGRLRAVQAKSPVLVEIYGLLPIQGFGLKVDQILLERTGRVRQKTRAHNMVASAILTLGEARTRKGISDYIFQQGGGRISNHTIDSIMDEVRAYAIKHEITLIDAARRLCQITNTLLKDHNGDAIAAALDADTRGVTGAALVALVIHQGRQEAPGTQRAGP